MLRGVKCSQRGGGCSGGCWVRSIPLGSSLRDGPPAQGGLTMLGRIEASAPLTDVPVIRPSSPTEWWIFWLRHRDRYTLQTVQKSVVIPQVQFLVRFVTWPSLCNDRPGWSRQLSLEVPQVQYLRGGGSPCGHAATSRSSRLAVEAVRIRKSDAYASLLRFSHLSPGLRAGAHFFGALDDEEFFVIEGWGVAGTPGVRLPGVLSCVQISLSDSLHRTHSCGHTHC